MSYFFLRRYIRFSSEENALDVSLKEIYSVLKPGGAFLLTVNSF